MRLKISPNEKVLVVILFLISSFDFWLVIIAIVTSIYLNINSKHSLDTSTYLLDTGSYSLDTSTYLIDTSSYSLSTMASRCGI